MHAIGEVRGCYTNRVTGVEYTFMHQKNLILHEGADLMASLSSGDRYAVPSHMYFHYENTNGSITSQPTVARADGGSYFRSLDGVTPPHDWLRVPIISTPKISIVESSEETGSFAGNTVTFSASSAASSSLTGESPQARYFASSGDDGPSKVFGLALVAQGAGGTKASDRVFSRLSLSTPSVMLDGNHLTFYWIIKFN